MKRRNSTENNAEEKKKREESMVSTTSGFQSNDSFRIIYDEKDVIGKGAISSVFRGSFHDAQRHQQSIGVAVKVIKASSADTKGEKALAPQFQHPNIVKLFHAENQSTNRCYALEICDASLDKVFSGSYTGPLPSPANSLIQLSKGLEFIHSNGLIHGSVKPENVLVSAGTRQLKWADFGLYKFMLGKKSSLNIKEVEESEPDRTKGIHSNKNACELLYLAPELVKSLHQNGQDPRKSINGDIFASGCVFGQLLTGGHHPFGSSDDLIVSNIKEGDPVNLGQLSSHYAHDFIKKMLRKNEDERKGALKELIQHIETSGKIQAQKEFLDLCSVTEPIIEEANQLRRMVQFDDVDVNQPGEDGNPPLVQLVRSNRRGNRLKESIEALLVTKEGQVLDVNKQDERKYNALHLLCINCDQHAGNLADIVGLLVRNGMKTGETDPEGKNALHHLCKNYKEDNLVDIIRLLNVTDKDVNCRDSSSYSPLHHLCRWYQHTTLTNIVELFIEKGADVNIPTNENWTALHFLCQFYNKGENLKVAIQLLIRNGADVNCTTSDGLNTLHFLCKRYHNDPSLFEVIRLLVSKGVDVNAKTSVGATVFKILRENDPDGDNTKEVVQFLLKNAKTLPPAPENRSNDQNVTHFHKIQYTELLGSGCYANVFKGTYTATKGADPIQVAVKRVIRQSQTDRELDVLRSLEEHSNVVKFYDFEDQHTDRLYALELCQGTLERAFLSDDDDKKYRGPLPSPANLLVQLSNGLDHIHSKSVHRDIKPDNILISSTGPRAIAKWADFGLSKPMDAQGAYVLSRVSTARLYWSPETYEALSRAEERGQLTSDYAIVGEDEKGTASSDIFAFGCLIFWFLTGGLHPFGSTSNIKTNVEAGNPVYLHKLSRHYALPFIKKMLNHRPKERKGVLKELVDHIESSKKLETEFADLCSLADPIPEEINQLRRMVLSDGIDINQADPSSGMTPLMRLCASNRSGVLLVKSFDALMTRKGQTIIQMNKKDRNGNTALHIICRNYAHSINLIDIVRLLVGKGVNVNLKTSDGWTPLQLLCRHYTHSNLIDIVRLLVEKGVGVNCKTSDGCTPLHILCENYRHDNLIHIVRFLVDKGADVKCQASAYRWTPLHILCRYYTQDNLVDIVRLLVEKGVDVNSQDSSKNTALNLLCQHYRNPKLIRVVRYLLQKGADARCQNSHGWNALHNLCHNNYNYYYVKETYQLLLDSGIDDSVETNGGCTALELLEKRDKVMQKSGRFFKFI